MDPRTSAWPPWQVHLWSVLKVVMGPSNLRNKREVCFGTLSCWFMICCLFISTGSHSCMCPYRPHHREYLAAFFFFFWSDKPRVLHFPPLLLSSVIYALLLWWCISSSVEVNGNMWCTRSGALLSFSINKGSRRFISLCQYLIISSQTVFIFDLILIQR